jgi:hypothetical protein
VDRTLEIPNRNVEEDEEQEQEEEQEELAGTEEREGTEEDEKNEGQDKRSLKINIGTPTLEEVKKAIKQLKNRKAPGIDNIPPDIIIAHVDTTAKLLCPLTMQIWKEEKYPYEWNEGIIIELPKKGDPSNCNNWRGIMLLSIVRKVFSRMILNRIQGPVDKIIRKEQAGFRANNSCADYIHTLRIIIEQSMEWKSGSYVKFIDFEKAFDS